MIFILSLQDVLGDNNLVNLVDDWDDMEHYASRASSTTARAYQTTQNKNKVQVRVLVGKFGFEKEFSDLNDPLLSKILAFCNAEKFLNVDKTVPDEQFFK
jgi:hypothetical protein